MYFAAKEAYERRKRARLKEEEERIKKATAEATAEALAKGLAEGRKEYKAHILNEVKQRDEISKDELIRLISED